jgi:hypothetical protein
MNLGIYPVNDVEEATEYVDNPHCVGDKMNVTSTPDML